MCKGWKARIPKKVFKAKLEGIRSVGKPRKRWEDVVQQDAASFLRCRSWKLAANDITLWRQKIRGGQGPIWAASPLDGWMEGMDNNLMPAIPLNVSLHFISGLSHSRASPFTT
jgi:hypothetical protein